MKYLVGDMFYSKANQAMYTCVSTAPYEFHRLKLVGPETALKPAPSKVLVLPTDIMRMGNMLLDGFIATEDRREPEESEVFMLFLSEWE